LPAVKVILLSAEAIAVLVSAWVFLVVSVCACASCDTLMVYLPAIALPVVVALNAVVLLAVLVAVNRSALFSAVFAV
jgi:fumarate reductase subunit C